MSRGRHLCLGVVVGLALLAVIIPASASATTLCKEAMKTCEAAKKYPAKTEFKGQIIGEATIKTGSLLAQCANSTINFKTSAIEGTPLGGEVTEFIFGGCKGCTVVSAIRLGYHLSMERTAEGAASLTFSKGAAGDPAIKISGCTGGVSCTFQAEALAGFINGAAPATYAFNSAPMSKEGGGGCASEAFLSAAYKIDFAQEPGGMLLMFPGVWPEF